MAKKNNNRQLSLGWRELAKQVQDAALSHAGFKRALKSFGISTKTSDMEAYELCDLIIVDEKLTRLHPDMLRASLREEKLNNYFSQFSIVEDKKVSDTKIHEAKALLESCGYLIFKSEDQMVQKLEKSGYQVFANEEAIRLSVCASNLVKMLMDRSDLLK